MTTKSNWLRTLGAIAALAVIAAIVGTLFTSLRLVDLEVYAQAGNAVLHGNPLYDLRTTDLGLAFTYPPFAALVFVPLGLLGTGSAALAWSVISLAALVRAVFLCLRSAGLVPADNGRTRRVLIAVIIATALALALEPTLATLAWGQINLILMWLVLEDFVGDVPPRWRGVLVGLATAVKLAPAVFILFAVVIGWRREALRSILVVASSIVVGLLLPGAGGRDYWTREIVSSDRIGYQDSSGNQSLVGTLARALDLVHAPAWSLLISGLVIAVAMIVGRRLWIQVRQLEALSVVAIGMLLASPIAWTHHWVWIVAVLIALIARARAQRSTAALAAIVAVVTVTWVTRWGGGYHSGSPELMPPLEYAQWLASDAYVIVGLLALGWWTWSAFRVPSDQRSAVGAPR